MKITVFTPTYNRAYILNNLYQSLRRQTFRDFEWLIVDDGSVDDTEALVCNWMAEGNLFTIRYHKQENGGKCRAINKGLELAAGELFFTVDSDDYLTDDALEKVLRWETELPKNQKYCGFAGNLGTAPGETPNKIFESEYFDGTALDRYGIVDGERAIVFYTDIHRMYPYPVFDGEKFMTEAVVYNRMASDGFKMRFYNDIIWIYEYLTDGLTKAGSSIFLNNPQGHGLWLREKSEFLGESLSKKMMMWYSFYCDHAHHLTAKQCAEYIGAPLSFIWLSAVIHSVSKSLKSVRNIFKKSNNL